MREEVLSRMNTRRLLWECEKDETPQERMRRGGSTLAKRTKCIQAASLKATFYSKTTLHFNLYIADLRKSAGV